MEWKLAKEAPTGVHVLTYSHTRYGRRITEAWKETDGSWCTSFEGDELDEKPKFFAYIVYPEKRS